MKLLIDYDYIFDYTINRYVRYCTIIIDTVETKGYINLCNNRVYCLKTSRSYEISDFDVNYY